jgi:iron(III) transport system permease protein
MLTPAVTAGALLTFASSMSSYTALMLFHVDQVMTQQIVIAKLNGELGLASVVSVRCGGLIAFLVVLRTYEKRRAITLSKEERAKTACHEPFLKTFWDRCILHRLFSMLLIAMIFSRYFPLTAPGTSPLPSRYTIGNFASLFTNPSPGRGHQQPG